MIHNFILGVLTPGALTQGGHSTWIDYIAMFGCGILVYYKALISYIKGLYREADRSNKKTIVAVSILYIVSGIFNSFQIALFSLHIFVLLPYLHEILIKTNYDDDICDDSRSEYI